MIRFLAVLGLVGCTQGVVPQLEPQAGFGRHSEAVVARGALIVNALKSGRQIEWTTEPLKACAPSECSLVLYFAETPPTWQVITVTLYSQTPKWNPVTQEFELRGCVVAAQTRTVKLSRFALGWTFPNARACAEA